MAFKGGTINYVIRVFAILGNTQEVHNLNEKARKEEEEEKVRADWMFAAMVTTLIYSKLCLEKTVVLCVVL